MMKNKENKRNICIFTSHQYGYNKGGLSLRYFELAKLFRQKGFKVTLLTENLSKKGNHLSFIGKLNKIIKSNDIFIVQPDILFYYYEYLKDKFLIVDLICPFHIEHKVKLQYQNYDKKLLNQEYGFLNSMFDFSIKAADVLLCGNENQEKYFSETSKSTPMLTIPFFINKKIPPLKKRKLLIRQNKDDIIFVWFGGLWDWYDPFTLIKAFHNISKNNKHVKLYFLCGSIKEQHNHMLFKECMHYINKNKLNDKIIFIDKWIPAGKRFNYLMEADAAVTSFRKTPESILSCRVRDADYISTGLPVIVSDGSHFSDAVENKSFGIKVKKQNVKNWEQALLMMSDHKLRNKFVKNLRIYKSKFNTDDFIRPLIKLFSISEKNRTGTNISDKPPGSKYYNAVVIFGASKAGLRTLLLCKRLGLEVKYFVDSDVSKHKLYIENLPVFSPDKLLEKDFSRIIIASFPGRVSIEKKLKELGFSPHKDFIWFGKLS